MELAHHLKHMNAITFTPADSGYPPMLQARLGNSAPKVLTVLGNRDLLTLPKTSFFCSTQYPGNVVLAAYDAAAFWRDSGRCIISGFHSPIEQECLQILLRGTQPIIICPGRAVAFSHIPVNCKPAFMAGRILFLSPFPKHSRRITSESTLRRNEMVAALADEAYIAHARRGGSIEKIVRKLTEWAVPILDPKIMGGH